MGRGLPTRPDGVPHRFPFRLVDRVEGEETRGQVSICLSTSGFYSRGGAWSVALVAEALAQAIAMAHDHRVGAQARLVALHGVRLVQEVSAGDRLRVELREEGRLGGLRRFSCRALREGAFVAEATVSVVG